MQTSVIFMSHKWVFSEETLLNDTLETTVVIFESKIWLLLQLLKTANLVKMEPNRSVYPQEGNHLIIFL